MFCFGVLSGSNEHPMGASPSETKNAKGTIGVPLGTRKILVEMRKHPGGSSQHVLTFLAHHWGAA